MSFVKVTHRVAHALRKQVRSYTGQGGTFSVDFDRKGECKLNKQRLYIYIYIYIYLTKIVGSTFRGKS